MKILIIGLGSIARKHISAIRQIEQKAEIFALRSNGNAEAENGIKNIFSLEEAMQINDFDFAVISNPTSEHVRTIVNLVDLNIPLFIEKPLSNSLDIDAITKKIKEKGILTYIACNLRFLDALKFVKKHLETTENRINEVNIYCGSYLPGWRPNVNYKNTYSARKELGGGVHIDLIHEIDYTYWLFGKPEKITKIFKNNSSLHINAFDYANYCLEYDTFCAEIVLNYYRRDYKRTLEILFDEYTWVIDLHENGIKSGNIEVFSSKQSIQDTYLEQMQYFCNLINNKEETSFNSIEEAGKVLRICLEDEIKR